MAQAKYPYLDLTVLPEIIPHVIAPHAAVLFSPDSKEVLWANGEGAKLIGTPTIGLAIEGSVVPNMSTMRQIKMAVEKLENAEQASAAMRLRTGFKTKLLAFNVSQIVFTGGDQGVLLITDSLHNRGHTEADMAQAAVDCLDGSSHASAIFDGQGSTIGESSRFKELEFAPETLKELADEISIEDDRLIKRIVQTAEGPMACGIARVGDAPSLHLMILTETEADNLEESAKKPTTKRAEAPKPESTTEVDIEPEAPRVGAFSSKRLKPGADGLGRWYYKQQSTDESESAKAKPDAAPETEEKVAPKETVARKTTAKLANRKAKTETSKTPTKTKDEKALAPAKPTEAVDDEKAPAQKSIIRKPIITKLPAKAKVKEEQEPTSDKLSSGGLIQTTDHTPIDGPTLPEMAETGESISSPRLSELKSEAVPQDDGSQKDQGESADGLRFAEGTRPVRFVWEMDAGSVFTLLSGELADAVGEEAASLVGLSWQEVSWFHGVDQDKEIATLLEKGDTWSGKTVLWPVHGADIRVPIDLAALPSYGRNREFEGFNGFGIIRLSDAVVDAEANGVGFNGMRDRPESLRPKTTDASDSSDSQPTPPSAPFNNLSDDELVSFPHQSETAKSKALSNNERDAFDEIGEKLGNGVSKTTSEPDARPTIQVETVVASKEPAPKPGVVSSNVRTPEHDVDTSILSRLPIPVLVYRNQDLLFANKDFFTLTGYKSLQALAAAGGVDALFGAHIDNAIDDDAKILDINGSKLEVFPNLQRVPWDDDRAMLLTLRRHGPDGKEKRPDDIPPSDPGSSTLVEQSLVQPQSAPKTVSIVTPPKVSIVRSSDAAAPKLNQPKVEKIEKPTAEFPSTSNAQSSSLSFLNNSDLHGILDTATDGVVILDKDGNVEALNRPAEALFDCDSKDAHGRPFIDFLAPESHLTASEYLDDLNNTGIASLLNDGREIIGKTAGGGLIPLFMTTGRIESSESRCAILKDITQWKKAEEELLSAKKNAEDASNQKTDFLAKVSHEVRTPLNAIIGFSDIMLEERFGKIENERYRGYIRDIHRSGTHVLDLINDLLDITKIEAGEMELNFGSCDLNSIVSETVALSQPHANEERIIIRTSLSAAVPNIVADQRSLRQIILNLVTNGIKFTKSGGQVIVSTAYDEKGEVILRVRDTGIGMTHEELDKALRPFNQVSNIAEAKRDGTGLGLPLTKALVESNRAKFHIESRPEEGTLVEIFFPSQRVLADR